MQTIAKLVDFEKKQAKLAEKKVVIKHETPKKKVKVVQDSDDEEQKESK